MKLIVGLGNPGDKYLKTRHNIGFILIDLILQDKKIEINRNKFNGVFIKTDNCIFAKPHTYMNLSGDFVLKIMNFYKIKLEDVLIICDDMDQTSGRFKIKKQGGSGGHNGIKSLINVLNTKNINRLQIGIGKGVVGVEHVLGNFSKEEVETMRQTIKSSLNAAIDFIDYDIDYIMNKYNRRR